MGRLSLNALGSGPAGPSLGGYLASGFTRTAAPAETSGQPSGLQ